MLIALTRAVPPSIIRCELTHLGREPIDVDVAIEQHRSYEEVLTALGCTVRRLPPEPDLPDSVFVEDTAVVLPEIAILTRPGAASRRAEVASVAEVLRSYRWLAFIESPGPWMAVMFCASAHAFLWGSRNEPMWKASASSATWYCPSATRSNPSRSPAVCT